MKKSIKTLATGIVALTLLFSACKKGDKGEPGAAGTNGNANVVSYTASVSSWTNAGSYWYASVNTPALVDANVNNTAMVAAYFSVNGIYWIAIPYTYVASTNYFMTYAHAVGTVEVDWTYNGTGAGSDPNTVFSSTTQLKVVIIPHSFKKPGVNYSNYTEVKKVYNLD